MNKYVKKSLKITGWIIGSIIGLFLLIVILIQIPSVQNYIVRKATVYLEEKIGTKVVIGRIEIGLPKKVILEDFYLEDQSRDTLVAGEKVKVDISLMKLMSNTVEISSVSLEGITAKVRRDKDSVFNFDYIIKAFDSGKPKDTTSEPMKISLGKISLDRVKVYFSDAVTKNDLSVNLKHFDTEIDKFDLDKSDFEVPDINLDGLVLNLKQGALVREIAENTAEVADSLSKATDFSIRLKNVSIGKVKVRYDNAGTQLNSGLDLDRLKIKFDESDIQNQDIRIASLELKGLNGGLTLGKIQTPKTPTPQQRTTNPPSTGNRQPTTKPTPWNITLKEIDLSKIDFRFDDENSTAVAKGIDYKHLNLIGVKLKARDVAYQNENLKGSLLDFAMKDHSGVTINKLKTDFFYGPKRASLGGLYLETPKTILRDKLVAVYPSIESLSKNPGELKLDIDLKDSRVAFSDILQFVPTLENTAPFKDNPNAVLFINGSVFGKLSDLDIPYLEVSGIGSTRVAASARLVGLPDVEKAWFDLDIREIRTTAKDILTFVPKGTIPPNIKLPSQIALSGSFSGKLNNMVADVKLGSSYGRASVKGKFDGRLKNREVYDANVVLDNFDVGKLISNDSIGKISLRAKVKGKGLDPKTMTASLDGKLLKAGFNGYTYKDLNLKGKISGGHFDAVASMDDPNLTFDLVTSGDFKDKFPAVALKMNVDIADLEKLNLHAGPMKLKGKVDADFSSTDPDNLNGRLDAYHFLMANAEEQFQLDSINLIAVSTPDSNAISLKSQVLRADVNGKFQLTKIGAALQKTISRFYATKPVAEARQEDVGTHQLDFHVSLHNDPVLVKLLPDLTRLEPIDIRGSYDSAKDSIRVIGTIPRIVYAENTISGGVIDIETKADSIAYLINIDQIENATFQLPDTQLYGSIKDNNVDYTLRVRDLKGREHYVVAGKLHAEGENTEIHLNPDGLVLNYDPWNVDPENLIRIGKSIYADRFALSKDGSSLKIQSVSEGENPPLDVTFDNFEIGTVTKMVQKDSEGGFAMSGKINGPVHLKDLTTNPVFTTDLNIQDFSVSKDTVGNIAIKVDNQTTNTFNADVAITGFDNQVNVTGTYNTTDSSMNLVLDMQRLQMKSIQAFTMGALAGSEGFLNGRLDITGTTDAPSIRGAINFNDVVFKVTQLNSKFAITGEQITFNDQGIGLDRFTIRDEEQNKLNIIGNILTKDYRDFGFDLKVRSDNFKVIDSKEKDNQLFYGKLFIDTNLTVEGTLEGPIVGGSLKVNDNTDMTMVLPQNDPGIEERDGVVEFIDMDNPQLNEKLIVDEAIGKSKLEGMDVNVNIEIDKEATLSMVIDKSNGDFLKLKGEARLNGGIDPSGKTNLTGRYELAEGSYEMSFNLIKRKFDIQKGSYILWTGEPTSANISITAVYTANTAPIDLIGNQIAGMTAAEQNIYKQRLPFQTLLQMNGELLKPEITFDIQLPDKNYGVSSEVVDASRTKLDQLRQQPAELNKQVFALLLLNRFIGENPFASEAGGVTAESMARQSVSKILSQQLNNLAADVLGGGFELNFDLESTDDYTTGQRENRTDLNVGLSKKLLNDRLKVTVGSNFNLEGQQANEQSTNIAGDVAVDYQLTRDGRYLVRAYQKNEYQVTLQGQVVETGVGFIITMDYNQFKEIFRRSAEEKRLIREEKKKKAEKKKN